MNIKNLFKNKNDKIKTKKLEKKMSEEIASIKNAAQFYSFAKKFLNPDKILKQNGKTSALYRELSTEGQVATCIQSRNAGVTSLKYRIKCNDKQKEFYDNVLKVIDVPTLIANILKAPLFGYQPIEICWALTEDDYILPAKILAKPQEWFYYDNDGNLYFDRKGDNDGYLITEEDKKFLVPRNNPEYLNPYGHAIMSTCFWDIIFKRGGKELWIKFIERYGMPTAVGKYPEGKDDDFINDLLESLEGLIQDAVAAIPDNNTIEIIEAGGKSASADIYKELILYCDRSIAKTILGQTLTTDAGDSGSYALGNVHQQVREDIISSDVRLVEKYINILLGWIHELNFGDTETPEFEFYSEKEIDKTIAERDKILTETGVKFTKEYYQKTYDLEEDDFSLEEKNVTQDFSEGVNSRLGIPAQQYQVEQRKQQLLDDLIDSFSDADLEKIIEPKLRTIIQTFAEKRDMEEVYDELAKLYPEENSKSFEEILSKALFISDLLGNAEKSNDKK